MSHVVLLGDSVFDNASYVPAGSSVVEQLRGVLPAGWRVTLLAVDGSALDGVEGQLGRVPADATHLVVSAGGNDALRQNYLLDEPARSTADALGRFADAQHAFGASYRGMLRGVLRLEKPVVLCTIYDAIPGLEGLAVTALSLFNDVILREGFRAGVTVIDLRLVCSGTEDYSPLSAVEPSVLGGAKIAQAVCSAVTGGAAGRRHSLVVS